MMRYLILLVALTGCSKAMSRQEVVTAKLHCATRGMGTIFYDTSGWIIRGAGQPAKAECIDENGLLFSLEKAAR